MSNYESRYIHVYAHIKDGRYSRIIAEVDWAGNVNFSEPIKRLDVSEITKLHQAATRQYTEAHETTKEEYEKLRGQEHENSND